MMCAAQQGTPRRSIAARRAILVIFSSFPEVLDTVLFVPNLFGNGGTSGSICLTIILKNGRYVICNERTLCAAQQRGPRRSIAVRRAILVISSSFPKMLDMRRVCHFDCFTWLKVFGLGYRADDLGLRFEG